MKIDYLIADEPPEVNEEVKEDEEPNPNLVDNEPPVYASSKAFKEEEKIENIKPEPKQ